MSSPGLPGVVISVLNDAVSLKKILPSLTEFFDEIVVVDNHSDDDCREICQKFAVKHIFPKSQQRLARGQCWNEGASQIQSDTVLFLHVDTVISKKAVEHLKSTWSENLWDYSCFKIQFDENSIKFRILEWFSNFRSRSLKIIYGDQGFCIRKQVFDAIGGFPNEYLLEDLKINRFLRRYRFCFINFPIFPSTRKFHQVGFFRYLFLMNQVLLLNFFGIETKRIYQIYYSNPR
ncbi:MAG: glycosyltransferase [SAR324 cluster bacterium]|nr:glycosyltransferase [SAR324 cluster bacterium]